MAKEVVVTREGYDKLFMTWTNCAPLNVKRLLIRSRLHVATAT